MIVRHLEGETPEGSLRNRVLRVEAILSRSERMIALAAEQEKRGDIGSAKILKRKARDEDRMAMRLIGILTIEYGVDVTSFVVRARRIVLLTRNGNGANGNGTPMNGISKVR